MGRRVAKAIVSVLAAGCCGYCVLLWTDYVARSRGLDQLRVEVSHLQKISGQTAERQRAEAQLEELERLRRNHHELDQLAARIEGLRRTKALEQSESEKTDAEQIHRLEAENVQLRGQLEALKSSAVNTEARRFVDSYQLEHISRFFRSYARNNAGRYPSDFSELRYYLPENVYPSIETNRFEILASDSASESDLSRHALVRTKFEDGQNSKLYLFADGHLETRSAQ